MCSSCGAACGLGGPRRHYLAATGPGGWAPAPTSASLVDFKLAGPPHDLCTKQSYPCAAYGPRKATAAQHAQASANTASRQGHARTDVSAASESRRQHRRSAEAHISCGVCYEENFGEADTARPCATRTGTTMPPPVDTEPRHSSLSTPHSHINTSTHAHSRTHAYTDIAPVHAHAAASDSCPCVDTTTAGTAGAATHETARLLSGATNARGGGSATTTKLFPKHHPPSRATPARARHAGTVIPSPRSTPKP